MSDFGFDAPGPADQTPELPAALPVLPLKETVVFPQSMSPLAIGQERSVRLIDDVVAGDRLLTLITSRDESIESPGWDDIYDVGTIALVHKMIKVPDGTLRILVQGLERVSLDQRIDTDPYLLGEFSALPDIVVETPELEALTRNVQGLFSRIIGLAPYLPEELQLAAANVDDPSALAHLVASTLRTIKTQERQELLETLNVEERLRKVSAILSRELEVFELGSKIQSQVQSEMEKGQREYFLRQQLKAIQQELGEADPEQAEVNELRERLGELTLLRGRRQGGGARARAAREAASGGRGVRRDPHLPRVDPDAPVGNVHRGQPRSRARPGGPRRRPFRPREGEGPHHRVPRRRQAAAGGLGPDPVFRRPSRRRQDLARPLDRERARPQVRPALGRRRPRRVRDPRPSPHLHRLDARNDPAVASRRRVGEPGAADRRDRQDGRRLARRSRERDARGTRSGAEQDVPRPLPRPAVRPLEDALHLHGQRASTRSPARCSTGWT